MNGRYAILLLIFSVVRCQTNGIAIFSQISEQQQTLKLYFSKDSQGQIRLSSSFQLPETLDVSWKIHELPVKMGSDSCSEYVVGWCHSCFLNSDYEDNQPGEPVPTCVEGTRLSISQDLPRCAQMIGKDGIIGRSIVLTTLLRSAPHKKTVYCSTIFSSDQYQDEGEIVAVPDEFVSTIAWFNKPFAGFIAFRKQSLMQSYIIINITRIDSWTVKKEELKWEIRDHVHDNSLFGASTGQASSDCSEYNHKACAEGDLNRKHKKLSLSNIKVNLKMVIDMNLEVSTLTGKFLVLSNVTNGTNEHIVSWTQIEDLAPIRVDVPFIDGSVLSMLQRDDWSSIQHWFDSAMQNNHNAWYVTVHQVPTIQIFTGQMWKWDMMWTQNTFLPEFKTKRERSFLNHTYTLYGRDSMLYHGVSIKPLHDAKKHYSTITYKQGEERIGYSKLQTVMGQDDQQVFVLVIEHTVLRQTTFLIATMCHITRFFLELTDNDTCTSSTSSLYNPYEVCPASCSSYASDYCSHSKCSHSKCCSACIYNSSFLCPVGDLRRRLGIFPNTQVTGIRNTETMFTVQNDIDLPLDQMVNKYIGLIMYNQDAEHLATLLRCGVVQELQETVFFVSFIDGNMTISQKAAWQPLIVHWTGIKIISLTFWKTRQFDVPVCRNKVDEVKYMYDKFQFSPITLPKGQNSPSFFGPNSVLEKSLTIYYRTEAGVMEEKRLNIKPSGLNNVTHNLQAIFSSDNQNLIKFDFRQRSRHLTEETYITVEIMSRRYCPNEGIVQTIKWYIIDRSSAGNYSIGQKFDPIEYDDSRFFHQKNGECPRKSPKNYMGDLNGIFGDIILDGPGKIYIHDVLPLVQAEGQYLFLADTNNTIIAKLELKKAPRAEELPILDPPEKSNNNRTVIIVCVCLGVLIIACGSAFVCKLCFTKNRGHETEYTEMAPDTINQYPDQHATLCKNILTNRMVWVYPGHGFQLYYTTKDYVTGEEDTAHNTKLCVISTKDMERRAGGPYTLAESNGSTNGSTLTRSRGTVAEENHYTTVSPTVMPNSMIANDHVNGSVVGTPESSNSSLSSHETI